VEEYYLIYPDFPQFIKGWTRIANRFVPVANIDGYVSHRLDWTFHFKEGYISIDGLDGHPLRNPIEIKAELEELNIKLEAIEEKLEAIEEKLATVQAERDAVQAERDAERERAAKLFEQLRKLGVEPEV